MSTWLYEENPRRRRSRRGRRRRSSGRRRRASRRNPSNPGNPRRRRRSGRRRSSGRRRRGRGRRRNPALISRAGLMAGVGPALTLFGTQWVGEFLTGAVRRVLWGTGPGGPRFGVLQMLVGVAGGMLGNRFKLTRPYARQFAVSNLAFGAYNASLGVVPTGADIAQQFVPAKGLLVSRSGGGGQVIGMSDWLLPQSLGEAELYGGLGDFAAERTFAG